MIYLLRIIFGIRYCVICNFPHLCLGNVTFVDTMVLKLLEFKVCLRIEFSLSVLCMQLGLFMYLVLVSSYIRLTFLFLQIE